MANTVSYQSQEASGSINFEENIWFREMPQQAIVQRHHIEDTDITYYRHRGKSIKRIEIWGKESFLNQDSAKSFMSKLDELQGALCEINSDDYGSYSESICMETGVSSITRMAGDLCYVEFRLVFEMPKRI